MLLRCAKGPETAEVVCWRVGGACPGAVSGAVGIADPTSPGPSTACIFLPQARVASSREGTPTAPKVVEEVG